MRHAFHSVDHNLMLAASRPRDVEKLPQQFQRRSARFAHKRNQGITKTTGIRSVQPFPSPPTSNALSQKVYTLRCNSFSDLLVYRPYNIPRVHTSPKLSRYHIHPKGPKQIDKSSTTNENDHKTTSRLWTSPPKNEHETCHQVLLEIRR